MEEQFQMTYLCLLCLKLHSTSLRKDRNMNIHLLSSCNMQPAQVPGRVTTLVSGQPHLLTPGPLLGVRTAALAALLAVSAAPITSLSPSSL